MENTKVYVVRETYGGMFMTSSPHKVFYSKREADFYVWQKHKEVKEESKSNRWSYSYGSYYSVCEVDVGSIPLDENNKDYKKFVAEKVAEIDEEIKKKEECAEKDNDTILRLQKEKESLSNHA